MGVIYKNGIRYSGGGGGADIPTPTTSDVDKVLKVNGDLDLTWGEDSDSLPSYYTSDNGKVLTINAEGTGLEWDEIVIPPAGDYMDRVNPVGEGLFKMNTTSTLSTTYKDNYIFGSSSDILNVLDGTVSTAVEGNKIFGSNNTLSLATRYPSTAFSDEGAPTTATKAHNTTIIGTNNRLTLPQPTSVSGHTSVDSSNNTIIGEGISIDATDYSSFGNNIFIGSGGYLKPNTPAADAHHNIFLNAINGFTGTAQKMLYNIIGGAFNNNANVTTAEYNVILADNSTLGASGSGVRLEHNNIFGSQQEIYGTTAKYSTIMGHGHAIYYADNLTHATIEGNAIVVSPDPSKENSGVANSGPYCGGHFEGYHHYIGYSSSAREGWHVEGAYNKVYPSVNQNYSIGLHIEGVYNALNNGSTVYCGHVGGYYNELNYGSVLGHGSKLEGSNNKITGSGQVLNGSIMSGISNTLQNGSTADYGSQINGSYNKIQNSTKLAASQINGYQSTVQMIANGYGVNVNGSYNLVQNTNNYIYGLSVDGTNTTVQGAGLVEGTQIAGRQLLVSMNSNQPIYGSHIEGDRNKIYGDRELSGVHIEGCQSTIYNNSQYSWGLHVEGNNHQAYLFNTYGAHIEGDTHYIGNSTAYAYFEAGHLEGRANYLSTATTAIHVEGYNNHVEGDVIAGHVEGYASTVGGNYAHAGGSHTIANQDSQTVIGTYNTTSADALFIVGNGVSTATSNALEVNKDGSANLQGDLTVHYNGTAYNVGQNLAAGALPAVTTADAGKVLSVDSSGVWSAATAPRSTYATVIEDISVPAEGLISTSVTITQEQMGGYNPIITVSSNNPYCIASVPSVITRGTTFEVSINLYNVSSTATTAAVNCIAAQSQTPAGPNYSYDLWEAVQADLNGIYTGSDYTLSDLQNAYDGSDIVKYVRIPVCKTIGGSTPDGYLYIFSSDKNAVHGSSSSMNGQTARFIIDHQGTYNTQMCGYLISDNDDHYNYYICIRPDQIYFGKHLTKGTQQLNINWKLGPYASLCDIDKIYRGSETRYTKLVGDNVDVSAYVYSNDIVAKGDNYLVDYDGRCFYYPTTP